MSYVYVFINNENRINKFILILSFFDVIIIIVIVFKSLTGVNGHTNQPRALNKDYLTQQIHNDISSNEWKKYQLI